MAGGNGHGDSDRRGKEKELFRGGSGRKDNRRRLRAYYVEKGIIKYPIERTSIHINMLDLMKNIISIGSDSLTIGRFTAPSLLVDNVKILGKLP